MYNFKTLQHNANKILKNFRFCGLLCTPQPGCYNCIHIIWNQHLFLEKAVAQNEKLDGMYWTQIKPTLFLEKAVATNKNKNGSSAGTFEKTGPPNTDSAP